MNEQKYIPQHEPGAKLDSGKVRVGLMFKGFPRALMAVAEVVTFGADKYTPLGFLEVENGEERYDDAKGRHILEGQLSDYDEDSGLLHIAHEAWNSLAKLEFYLREKEKSDE